MAARYDCVVVGGGVMGAAAAWALARAGRRVLLLEQFVAGHGRGSSHGDGRIYRTLYGEAEYVRLMRRALTLWRDLEAASGEPLLCECGCLATCTKEEMERLQPVLKVWDDHAVPYALLDAAECRERFPQFHMADDEVGIFQAQECGVVFASTATLTLWRQAEAAGADCRDNTRVADISIAEDGIVTVTTEQGERFEASKLVLAGGAWNRHLGAHFGLRLPFTVTREMVAYFPLAEGAADHTMHRMPAFVPGYFATVHEVYVLPQVVRPQGSFLQEKDVDGVKVGLMWQGTELQDDELDDPPDDPDQYQRYVTELRRTMAHRFPQLVPQESSALRCLYTTTPDHHFVIDVVPGWPQVVLLGGFSGHGFKFAPAVGEAAADLVLGRPPAVPLHLFSLTRDALRPTAPAAHSAPLAPDAAAR